MHPKRPWLDRANGFEGDGTDLDPTSGKFPEVVSSQFDVLPAEGRQVGKVNGIRMVSLVAQVIDRALQLKSGMAIRQQI
jgi:hypothetical protein